MIWKHPIKIFTMAKSIDTLLKLLLEKQKHSHAGSVLKFQAGVHMEY